MELPIPRRTQTTFRKSSGRLCALFGHIDRGLPPFSLFRPIHCEPPDRNRSLPNSSVSLRSRRNPALRTVLFVSRTNSEFEHWSAVSNRGGKPSSPSSLWSPARVFSTVLRVPSDDARKPTSCRRHYQVPCFLVPVTKVTMVTMVTMHFRSLGCSRHPAATRVAVSVGEWGVQSGRRRSGSDRRAIRGSSGCRALGRGVGAYSCPAIGRLLQSLRRVARRASHFRPNGPKSGRNRFNSTRTIAG
jgi:hypothetical protein